MQSLQAKARRLFWVGALLGTLLVTGPPPAEAAAVCSATSTGACGGPQCEPGTQATAVINRGAAGDRIEARCNAQVVATCTVAAPNITCASALGPPKQAGVFTCLWIDAAGAKDPGEDGTCTTVSRNAGGGGGVPTASEWGLIALGGLVLGGGVFAVTRRRPQPLA